MHPQIHMAVYAKKMIFNVSSKISDIKIQVIIKFGTSKSINTYLIQDYKTRIKLLNLS